MLRLHELMIDICGDSSIYIDDLQNYYIDDYIQRTGTSIGAYNDFTTSIELLLSNNVIRKYNKYIYIL